MIKDIAFILGITIGFLLIGLSIEIYRFQGRTPREHANQLKRDIVDIVKGFLEKPKIRHIFDPSLASDFRTIVKEYSVVGMDIDVVQNIIDGIPFVGIEFVPNHPFEAEVLSTLCEHIKIKFRRYMTARNLSCKCFTTYNQSPNDIQIYIYYSEFDEDRPLVESKYKEILKEKCDTDFGYLRDEDLDKEIKDVNPPRI